MLDPFREAVFGPHRLPVRKALLGLNGATSQTVRRPVPRFLPTPDEKYVFEEAH